MSDNQNEDQLYNELENAAKGRNAGRKSRVVYAVLVSLLAALIIPPLYAFIWFAAVLTAQFIDGRAFNYLARIQKGALSARQGKILANIIVGFSTIIFAALGPVLWELGGTAGKLFAILLLNASLVHSSILLSRARFLYLVSVLPFVIPLLVLPLCDYFIEHTLSLNGLIAVFFAMILPLFANNKAYKWLHSVMQEQQAAQLSAEQEAENAERMNAQLMALNQALDTHAMVTRSTPEGVLLSVNDAFCEKTQYSREELIGHHHTILDSGHHSKKFFEDMQAKLNAGKVWAGLIQNKAKDGSLYWGDTTISPIKNGDGKITECISIRRDITDLLEARKQAERANQAKSEFLAMMSHELRTPMNAVLGMASLLKASDLNTQQREYITALTDGGEMLMTVLNDILDLSKIEAGKLEMETIEVDVRHAVKRLERLWAPNAEDKGLSFICTIDDDVPSVIRGDITRIRQIVYNLLSNAVKFTEQGEVCLHVSAESISNDKARIFFAVRDTGVGISEEAQSRLFTSFEQADKSVTRKFGGTGLGLAISKKLAQLMNGDISIASKPGEGTCFTFVLESPVVTRKSLKDAEKESSDPAIIQTDPSKTRLRILAAEDNPLNQRVLKAFLQPFNYDVIMVEDGVEALEQLASQSFDLVLMDVQMPRKDGMTTTREIRSSDGPNANIPIIAMTANAMSGDRQKCIDIGMTDYVAKPIDPRVLLTAIARASAQNRTHPKTTRLVNSA
ncbi:MAG: hypothetical protein COA85_13145 [Robiginitomaculum sp.]|nr:MAG: hypothetical protein COA85_13145 [Robiginitomaculum sp.]